jgi:hypothetical protein
MIIMMIFNIPTTSILYKKFISQFLELFNDKTDLRVRYGTGLVGNASSPVGQDAIPSGDNEFNKGPFQST